MNEFQPEHEKQLLESGIFPGVAKSAGWKSVDHQEAKERGLGEESGLLIPYFDPESSKYNGFARLRLDHERDGQKYSQPHGTRSRLYFPSIIHSVNPDEFSKLLRGGIGPSRNVFIVEGEKKALSLQSRLGTRALVLGIGGCWNWTKTTDNFDRKSRALIDDFRHVDLRDRTVYLSFDSDVCSNPQVAKAERELSFALRHAGAKDVRLITLLPGESGKKIGLDDWLVEMGEDWEGELRNLCHAATRERQAIPRIYSYREMLEKTFKPIKVILGHTYFPLLNSGGLCYIHSTSGVGKTYFSMQMAHALATGSKFLGEYPTSGPQRVVFLQAELSDGWFQRRVQKLDKKFGDTENLWVLNGQMTFGRAANYGKFNIDLSALEQIIVSHRADVVFIDPLQGYLDLPENHTDANREFQRRLSKLRHRHECAIVVTHHDRKDNSGEGMHRMRGSSVLSDWADVVLGLDRETVDYKDDDGKKQTQVVPGVVMLDFNKARHAEGERPALSRLRRVADGPMNTPWLEMHPEQG